MPNYFSRESLDSKYASSKDFFLQNRIKVNKYLNKILWICVLTGPAIAVGIYFGIFSAATYFTCFIISLATGIIALIHRFLISKWPQSNLHGTFALLFIECLLAYMEFKHIHIRITWFFVPIVSILYCNVKEFVFSVMSNFAMLTISTWFISPYNASINSAYPTPRVFFINSMAGYIIETVVMLAVGCTLAKMMRNYFIDLLQKHDESKTQISQLEGQMNILNSMAGIYQYANLLDYNQMTEMSLLNDTLQPQHINLNSHAHSRMNHMIKRKVIAEHFDAFQEFTNMRTLQERLKGKKVISKEFISKEKGWFRAQYISVESNSDGVPVIIIYTIQSIDEDKKREEHLVQISLTDELTKLYNRRSFDEDIEQYKKQPLDDNFALFSVDLNRLKYANDSKGHAAGDELIKGSASCLVSAVGNSGKVYRTGGDEFTLIVFTDDAATMKKRIEEAAAAWHGEMISSLTMSVGYAAHKDYPNDSIEDLEKVADSMMYEAKNQFYKESGLDRRGKTR